MALLAPRCKSIGEKRMSKKLKKIGKRSVGLYAVKLATCTCTCTCASSGPSSDGYQKYTPVQSTY